MRPWNGSVPALPVAEVARILCEPTKPPDGSPPSVMTDYYAAKRRWNEQPRSSIGETNNSFNSAEIHAAVEDVLIVRRRRFTEQYRRRVKGKAFFRILLLGIAVVCASASA